MGPQLDLTQATFGRPQESSILSLEKSTAPFSEQIFTACRYLDIDLESENGTEVIQVNQPLPHRSNPRVDYALRWLLKKLSSFEAVPNDLKGSKSCRYRNGDEIPCLNSYAWLFLKALVGQTLVPNVARLLKEYKFLDILEFALSWIVEGNASTNGTLHSDSLPEREADLCLSSDESVSSLQRRNLKRKRGQNDPVVDTNVGRISFSTVNGLLELLLQITQNSINDSQVYETEYLTASLSTSPQQGASILGYALKICSPPQNISQEGYLQPTQCTYSSLTNFHKIWNLATEDNESPTNFKVHLSFSRSCLITVLDWLNDLAALNGALASLEQPLQKTLEDLVIANITLPCRIGYLNANRPEKMRNPEIPTTLTADLLAPLKSEPSILGTSAVGNLPRPNLHRTPRRIALLFRLATENPPCVTPKQKAAEITWLQKLFSILIDMGTEYDAERSGDSDSSMHDWHYPILQVALNKNIRLDPTTLKGLLIHHSGLLTQGPSVNWDMISACIKIEPNLWITSNILPPTHPRNTQVQRDDLLLPLLQELSNYGFVAGSGPSPSYDTLLCNIMYPLIDAFVKGRNLRKFIKLWGEKLAINMPERHNLGQLTIWEDEALIQYVSQRIETSFTYSQIVALLSDFSGKTTALSDRTEEFSDNNANLVILDTILSAEYSDRVLEELEPAVSLLYNQLLTEVVTENTSWKSEQGWKLIMLIRDRQLEGTSISENEKTALNHAVMLVTSESDEVTDKTRLEAFRFMMRLTEMMSSPRLDTTECSQLPMVEIINNLLPRLSQSKSEEIALPQTALKPPGGDVRTRNQSMQLFFANILLARGFLEFQPLTVAIAIVNAMYKLTSGQAGQDRSEELTMSFSRLWDHVVQVSSNGNSKVISEALSAVIHEEAMKVKTSKYSDLAISTLPALGPQLLRNRRFALIANQIISTILDMKTEDSRLLDLLRALESLSKVHPASMSALAQPSDAIKTSTGQIPSGFFDLARRLDRDLEHRSHALQELQHFQKVVSSILTFFGRQSQEKIDPLFNVADTVKHLLVEDLQHSWSTTLVIQICLNHLEPLEDRLNHQGLRIQALREHHCHLLQSQFLEVQPVKRESPQSDILKVALILDCLQTYSDVLIEAFKSCSICGHEVNGVPILAALQRQKPPFNVLNLDGGPCSKDIPHAWYKILGHQIALSSLYQDISDNFNDIVKPVQGLKNTQLAQEKRMQLNKWNRHATKEVSVIQNALREMVNSLHNQAFVDLEPLMLLQKLVRIYPSFQRPRDGDGSMLDVDTDPNNTTNKENREMFTKLLTGACNTAVETRKASMCILSLKCINTMLRSKAQCITQWHIDSIMACIAITAQRLKETHTPKAAFHIHIALTRIFGSILAVHRLKLGGRYHMILLALQALLHPIFIPFKASNRSKASPVNTTPIHDHSQTFTSTHTENLSRLLSSICDPTVSAVSHRRSITPHNNNQHGGALNDETKKARAESGKHMLYFIMDFCVLQLSGRMTGERMRETLMPGIWAVLNAMNREIMGAMNAQLSVPGREIWREVYAEWKREGRRVEGG